MWTLEADPNRCGSQFLFSGKFVDPCGDGTSRFVDPFYKQIALGTGLGLRLDLSFFVFRLDLGLKVRNPFPENGDPESASPIDYLVDPRDGIFLRNINYNLVLGYPF